MTAKRSEDTQAILDEIKRKLLRLRRLSKRLKEMVREGKIKDPTLGEGKLSSMRNALHSIGEFIIKRERRRKK